jgi:hypothetical protein
MNDVRRIAWGRSLITEVVGVLGFKVKGGGAHRSGVGDSARRSRGSCVRHSVSLLHPLPLLFALRSLL